jgi:hypothetical protein
VVVPKMPVVRLLPQGVPSSRQVEALHPAMTLYAAQLPYEEGEEEGVLDEDADEVYVEIGAYKFQPGDFTWTPCDIPHAAACAKKPGSLEI